MIGIGKKVDSPVNEKTLKQYNNTLLDHLHSSLEIMAKTKCPYFEIPGLGAIFMDEAFIRRYEIPISEKEINKATNDRNGFKDKLEKKNEYSPFKGIEDAIKILAKEFSLSINKISDELHKTNEIADFASSDPSPSDPIENHIVKHKEAKGTTAGDILNSPAPELPSEVEDEADLEPNRDITKSEAIQQVNNRTKPLTKKQIHFVNEARKSKQQIKAEAQKLINKRDEENI